ncbi:MAG: hypothetical protein IAX22_04815 [Candidatus Bathyarchaeota archaeon]|nr:hypothetical protein [Candidatus Bathyarchaeota archaeon]
MNLLPELNQFIEEIKEFQPETDLEQDGKKVLTFKGAFDNLRKIRTEIQKIKTNYPIDKYVTIKYSEPLTKHIHLKHNLSFLLDLNNNMDEQDLDNLTNELLANAEIINIILNGNNLLIPLKDSSYTTRDKLTSVSENIEAVVKKHNPKSKSTIPFNGKEPFTVTEYTQLVVTINMIDLHKDRLDYFYHRDMSNVDEAESIKYLVSRGLSASDIGISRSKYFRNKPEISVSL